MAMVTNCRVCGSRLFSDPLLRYVNMPKGAQFMPEAASLKSDKGVDLEVCQCMGCGLVQLNSEPVPYYREVIRAVSFSQGMKDFRKRQFAVLMKKYSLKRKKAIEIGCGRGEYLSLIRELGIDAYGLEYSRESAGQCAKDGLKVAKGFIDTSDYKLGDGPFKAFFIFSFLEHLPDPNSTLKGIYNNLADDAIGVVEVPDFDMIIERKLFSEFIPDHLLYFTRETLSFTLGLNGFQVIDCRRIWHGYIISAVVKKRNKLDFSGFYQYHDELKKELTKYTGRLKGKKIAVWGAGHQALAAISLLGLGDKIKYVVDSAPFKQGKFTPATHIPIVSPKMLKLDPVDAVIVMAGSFSDEVSGIIQEKFDKKMGIAILKDSGFREVRSCR